MRKLCVFFILIISYNIFSSDLTGDNYDWIYEYIAVDPSDDLYSDVFIKNYKINEDYVKSLAQKENIKLNNASVDRYNIKQNTNLLPRFPFIYSPYGGFSLNRGFDLGFLYKMDNFDGKFNSATFASSFGQNERFYNHFGFEFPNILNGRLSIFTNHSIYTSAPQYYSYLNYDKDSNFILNTFNKIWSLLQVKFNKISDFGIDSLVGVNYRIPLIELNSITTMKFSYIYIDSLIDRSGIVKNVKENNFYIDLGQEFVWNKLKQTETVQVGNILKASFNFLIPTSIGSIGESFKFKFRVEDRFYKKIYKEFLLKARFIGTINYNINDNFSGDPFIRGYKNFELTGWASALFNLEFLIPLVDVEFLSAVDQNNFPKPAKFILYLSIFADFGFVIDNVNYYTDYFWYRPDILTVKNSFNKDKLLYLSVSNGNYFFPAASAGVGLKLFPHFLHFSGRIDFAINITKLAVYQDFSDAFDIIISFSDIF